LNDHAARLLMWRAIAKGQGCSVAQVNRVIDAWAEEAIDDQLYKRRLCLELEPLGELMAVFYRRAVKDADVQSGFFGPKLIERRSVMLGLNATAPMTLQNLTARHRSRQQPIPSSRRSPLQWIARKTRPPISTANP
jgi:hypothetical protein